MEGAEAPMWFSGTGASLQNGAQHEDIGVAVMQLLTIVTDEVG